MGISPFPHLAFDEEGNLKPVGLDLDPFAPDLKAVDIPDKVGMMNWTDCLYATTFMIRQCIDYFKHIGKEYTKEISENPEAVKGAMRSREFVVGLMMIYHPLHQYANTFNYDEDSLKELCDALDRDDPNMFDLMKIAYRTLDKIEDLQMGAGKYFAKDNPEQYEKDSVQAMMQTVHVACFVGTFRAQLKELLKMMSDESENLTEGL